MKQQENHNYFLSLNLSPTNIQRALDILNELTILGFDTGTIFISDFQAENQDRIFDSLWIFTDEYCMEAKKFLFQFDYDYIPIQNRIEYWRLQKEDFNLYEASVSSKLRVQIGLPNNATADLRATGTNCNRLYEIFKKYIIPNVILKHG